MTFNPIALAIFTAGYMHVERAGRHMVTYVQCGGRFAGRGT